MFEDEEEKECMPMALEPESKHHSADYNCHFCKDRSCPYWQDFNF